LYNVGSWRN